MEKTQYDKEQDLLFQYGQMKELLRFWGNIVDSRIPEILQKNAEFNFDSIQIFPKFRLKSDSSLIGKYIKNKEISASSKPLLRIEDKIGTRIVVTSLRDILFVKDTIFGDKEIWETPRVSRNIDKNLELNPKEFDYNALHLTLMPSVSIKEFSNKSKTEREYYTCEIQIRSLLQHAFAEVAHDTVYKGPYSSNSKLVRLMSKAEALMEVTDEYFCNAYNLMGIDYEITFLNRLTELASVEFEHKFDKKVIDQALTKDIFEKLEVKKVNFDDIQTVLILEKKSIVKLLRNIKSYIGKQPIVLLLAYFIYTDRLELKEKWDFDELILKEMFQRLGYSFGKI
jgi:putative GTP pyrophosphokinase